jgi:hypothetical protein
MKELEASCETCTLCPARHNALFVHGTHGSEWRGETADWGRLCFMDRSDPLVDHTFEIMDVRAQYSERREIQRARGVRVCEEGENGTHWRERCNWCWCQWGS